MIVLIVFTFISSTFGAVNPVRNRPRVSSTLPGVPTSALSRAVAANFTNKLEAEFREAGLRLGSPIYLRSFKYSIAKLFKYVDQFLQGKAPRSRLNLAWYTDASVEVWVESRPGGPYQLFKSYPVCVFSGGLGPKKKEGDMQTPEGFYQIVPSSFNPNSQYRLSVNVGYPNAYDRSFGYTGGSVMIHGYCVSIGCLAMNDGIDEIYTLISASAQRGQTNIPFHMFPFGMGDLATEKALMAFPEHRTWWEMLKTAYDAFEKTNIPPAVRIILTRPAAYEISSVEQQQI